MAAHVLDIFAIELIKRLAREGKSKREIARFVGVAPGTVQWHADGLLKPRLLNTQQFFNGVWYYKGKNGWWRGGTARKGKTYLHRDVWMSVNGPIPKGHDINHIDHDKDNNHPSNLEALLKDEHGREGARWRAKRCS